MTLRDIAIKNLLRRKAKSMFILAGLTIGIATVVALICFVDSTSHDINTKLEKYGANILIVPRTDNLALSYGGMSLGGVSIDVQPIRQTELAGIRTIKNAANIAAVGPVVLGTVTIDAAPASLAGVDFEAAGILKPWWKIDGASPGPDGVLAGAEAARILGLTVGQQVTIDGQALHVSGILAPTGSQDDHLIFTHLNTAQNLLHKPNQISIVEVAALCHDCPVDDMVAQIAEQLPSAKVMAIQQVVKGRMETLAHFKKFSYALSLVVVAIGGLVVLVTMMGSVRERTSEIGIFRAVGFRRSHVMRIIFLEAGLISALAGIVGYLAGVGGVLLGLKIFGKATAAIHLDPWLAVGALVMAMAVGLLSSAYPALLAAGMDPNKALKTI
jgi:putative ABC transport system permease protein